MLDLRTGLQVNGVGNGAGQATQQEDVTEDGLVKSCSAMDFQIIAGLGTQRHGGEML